MLSGKIQRDLVSLLFSIFFLTSLSFTSPAQALSKSSGPFFLLTSPQIVSTGGTVRLLVSSEEELEGLSLQVKGPTGSFAGTGTRKGGGPPFWLSAEFKIGMEGRYTISLIKKGKTLLSRELEVPGQKPSMAKSNAFWETERQWNRENEDLYSAWIEALFQDADEGSSWTGLKEITQDPRRNILYNHLGLGEDNKGEKDSIVMNPDCADNPYFLRAYFAWKLRLPFGFHECTRGTLKKGPECKKWFSNSGDRGKGSESQVFNGFLLNVMNTIQSGSARTYLTDEDSDLYPLPLERNQLRPGVAFADPYGHTLVIVKWVAQTPEHPGELLAVSAQPDGSVSISRFWKGNFLFTTSEIIGAPGFKAFRPIIRENGRLRPLRNEEILKSKDYANFSLQQKDMKSSDFYDIMERLINPEPLDPATALHDLFEALHEQLLARVQSVAISEEYLKFQPDTIIPMPNGKEIFQTIGLWEDYSTPNRDLRLLIAMDTIFEFPDQVVRAPKNYKLPKGKSLEEVKKELEELHRKLANEMTITYIRSNGKEQTLSLEEIFKRKEAFEMSYNPNDCVEVRWGAPAGSEELSSCRRRAPASQQEKMKSMRQWFHERHYPFL
jgi:hypothetical protein